MKRLLLLLLLIPVGVQAQVSSSRARRLQTPASDPSSCPAGTVWVRAGIFKICLTNGVTSSVSTAAATPGGSNTQVQFNDSSAFGGDAGLTYNKTTDALSVGGALTSGGHVITSASANSLVVGPNGATNPVLSINSSVASQADGVEVKGNAAGSGTTIAATSSGSNAGFTFTPKGTGRFTLSAGELRLPANHPNGLSYDANTLIYGGGGTVTYYLSSANIFRVQDTTGARVSSSLFFGWASADASQALDTALGRNAAGVVEVNNGTAGQYRDLVVRKVCYSGTTVCDFAGSGSPEGAVTASVGSTYRRTDGGAGTSFYVKESGSGNTGWVAK